MSCKYCENMHLDTVIPGDFSAVENVPNGETLVQCYYGSTNICYLKKSDLWKSYKNSYRFEKKHGAPDEVIESDFQNSISPFYEGDGYYLVCDCDDSNVKKINFCPVCGRKLVVNDEASK